MNYWYKLHCRYYHEVMNCTASITDVISTSAASTEQLFTEGNIQSSANTWTDESYYVNHRYAVTWKDKPYYSLEVTLLLVLLIWSHLAPIPYLPPPTHTHTGWYMCVCGCERYIYVFVCVCVCKGDRDIHRQTDSYTGHADRKKTPLFYFLKETLIAKQYIKLLFFFFFWETLIITKQYVKLHKNLLIMNTKYYQYASCLTEREQKQKQKF